MQEAAVLELNKLQQVAVFDLRVYLYNAFQFLHGAERGGLNF